jgi:hypothetical protein
MKTSSLAGARPHCEPEKKPILTMILTRMLKCSISWETMIAIDHNHVAPDRHGER